MSNRVVVTDLKRTAVCSTSAECRKDATRVSSFFRRSDAVRHAGTKRSGRSRLRTFCGCFAGVPGLMTWNAFWRLGDTFVRDYDEARYGVAASEMLHRHSTLVTTEQSFLQVADGLVLSEAQRDRNSLSNGLVPIKKSAAGRWADDLLSEAVVLAQHEDYVLVGVFRC
jgi:hypothetical protein